jgi:hypothetical protein
MTMQHREHDNRFLARAARVVPWMAIRRDGQPRARSQTRAQADPTVRVGAYTEAAGTCCAMNGFSSALGP